MCHFYGRHPEKTIIDQNDHSILNPETRPISHLMLDFCSSLFGLVLVLSMLPGKSDKQGEIYWENRKFIRLGSIFRVISLVAAAAFLRAPRSNHTKHARKFALGSIAPVESLYHLASLVA